MLDLWHKNAVIYCLDVKTFMDADGDGIGDFRGLADRLDHIETLGATCIWLLPFYPSPGRDNGYDVTDYYNVDPRLGTLGDFVDFMRAARDRGFRVIVDLVANHTSIEHPWFQEARRGPGSRKWDWYVWSKECPPNAQEGMVFPGPERSTWSFDPVAGAWYLHRFYAHQPDLNSANPEVREEMQRVMGFWLELGVSGFRIDAAPFMLTYAGVDPSPASTAPQSYLTALRDFLSWRKAEAVLLAEANIPPSEAALYFGNGHRLHMVFDFVLNQHVFLGLAQQAAEPVARMLNSEPHIPQSSQWLTFLRNHDELDLGRLSEAEREAVFAAFAPDPAMRVYGRGIRRRLAPMMGGDARRIAMAHSLSFALPGTPVLWYGEEIGMGEDLRLPERWPVRTPMQWSDEPNAGFSLAEAGKLVRPVIACGEYGYQSVNVMSQREARDSMMGQMQRLIRTRRSCPEVGWGTWSLLETRDGAVLGMRYDWRNYALITLHNLADREATVRLDLPDVRLAPLLAEHDDRTPRSAAEPLTLGPYGFRWMRLHGERR